MFRAALLGGLGSGPFRPPPRAKSAAGRDLPVDPVSGPGPGDGLSAERGGGLVFRDVRPHAATAEALSLSGPSVLRRYASM